MKKLRKTPDRSNFDGKEAARQLYGGPPEADARSDGRRAAGRYRAHLRRRFGKDVPEAVVNAFAEAHRLGREHPDQIEALRTGLRASTTEKQRERVATGGGGGGGR